MPFDIPNIRAENGRAKHHVRIGWLRSVSNIYHAFALHSFMDELAHLAKRDPVDYLLNVLGSPRKIDFKAEGTLYTNYGKSLEQFPVDTGRLHRVIELAAANASGSCPYTAVPDASKVAFWWTVRLKWREGRALSCRHHHRYQSHMTQPSRLFVWPASFLTLPTRPVACLVWIIAVLDFAHAGTLDRTEPATIPSPASTSSP